jgi:hypothetical protein
MEFFNILNQSWGVKSVMKKINKQIEKDKEQWHILQK